MNKHLLMFAVGISLLATSCKSKKEKDVTAVYTVTTPEVTNTSIAKDYVANIQSEKNIEIRAQVGGILQDIYVDEGQMVKAGQPLVPHFNRRSSGGIGKDKGRSGTGAHRFAEHLHAGF
jgi:membrane fusion protein (multidrug efflux system)